MLWLFKEFVLEREYHTASYFQNHVSHAKLHLLGFIFLFAWHISCSFTGFYRVNYDPLTWSLITKHLTSPFYRDIHVLNRAQLLDDAFSLSYAGLLNYTTALELSTYLAEEIHLIPWLTYSDIISFINRQLYGTDIYNSFKVSSVFLWNKSTFIKFMNSVK